MERITHAAIRQGEKIYTGLRHADIIETIIRDTRRYIKLEDEDKGFMTDQGRFVSRREAGQIAFKAGQTTRESNYLQSYELQLAG